MSYLNEWGMAINRSVGFGFAVAGHTVNTSLRYLDQKRHSEFPYVVRDGLGDLDFADVVAQCLAINFRLLPVIAEWLQCPVMYTLGWVDDQTEKGMFRFDDAFISQKLRDGHGFGVVNMHAWLTLPSMEIIDVALSTSMGVLQGKPEMNGRVIAMYADSLKGMAYKPMLVGTDFLERSGIAKKILAF